MTRISSAVVAASSDVCKTVSLNCLYCHTMREVSIGFFINTCIFATIASSTTIAVFVAVYINESTTQSRQSLLTSYLAECIVYEKTYYIGLEYDNITDERYKPVVRLISNDFAGVAFKQVYFTFIRISRLF